MPVSQPSQDYNENLPLWQLMRALYGGEPYLKGKIGSYSAKDFLPEFDDKDDARYKAYVQRAVYYNYTGWTITGLTGSVFRKPHNLQLPKSIDFALDNIDGGGTKFETFAKDITNETLTTGRVGLFVDVTEAQVPKTVKYVSEAAIGYKVGVVNGNLMLTQVRLKEQKEVVIDEFTSTSEPQYRVLALDEFGQYYQQIYDKSDKPVGDPIYPRLYNGTLLNYIPFVFVGSENNNPDIDKPPMQDIGVIGLGHYRNSADREENLFIHGQGTLFVDIGEMSVDQWKELHPDGVKVGARTGHALGQGGKPYLTQVQEAGALKVAMDDKVIQMIGLGARFIQDRSDRQTATSANIGEAQQNSGLATLVGNVESGLKQCLEWMLAFAGGAGEITFEMNRNFYDKSITAQEASAVIMLADSGYMAKEDVRHLIKLAGWLRPERTDEEIDGDIELEPPKGFNIGSVV